MFEVTNISRNPLRLNTGSYLVPTAATKLADIDSREREYESRGWLRIIDLEEKAAVAAVSEKPPQTASPQNTGGISK